MNDTSQMVRQRPAIGVGTAFGTFGELLQGRIDAGDFLVTLPIARWASAQFRLDPPRSWPRELAQVQVHPPSKTKSRRLAEAILADRGCGYQGTLVISGSIPEGKGMASSSADLTATARAVGAALDVPFTPADIERYLRQIEPTDGVMYRGIVAYFHREVRLKTVLGALPSLMIVSVDEGGEVDTIAYNARPKQFPRTVRRHYHRLLEALSTAIHDQDLRKVGLVATESARLNQQHLHKGLLDQVLSISHEYGALGVVAAHSGPQLGVLMNPEAAATQVSAVSKACRELAATVTTVRTLGPTVPHPTPLGHIEALEV